LNRAARYRVNPVLANQSPQAAIASRGRVEQLPPCYPGQQTGSISLVDADLGNIAFDTVLG
jgi:hypothetical protein